MAAASYHSRILISKYGQTDNVKPLTANRGLQFAVGWPNLDLKVSIVSRSMADFRAVVSVLPCSPTNKGKKNLCGCVEKANRQ